MNTFKKSSSIALAIAFGFSMLATSTSLNAQSREDSDDAGSERSINASDAKPAAKPTVSFSQSVKAKVAQQTVAKPNKVEATPVVKTTSGVKVSTTPAAPAKAVVQPALKGQTGNKFQPVRSDVSHSGMEFSNDVVERKPIEASVTKSESATPLKNAPVVAPAKVAPAPVIVRRAAPAPIAAVKYENASPGRTPKSETHAKPSAPVQIATMLEQNEVKGAPANEKSR